MHLTFIKAFRYDVWNQLMSLEPWRTEAVQPSRWPRNHVEKKQRLTSERDWRQSNTVENKYAIPKINMLHNLSCYETRFRLLYRWYLLHSSLNLVFRQCKLHNIFLFGMAYLHRQKSVPWVLAESRDNRIVQSPHENYFNVCRQHKEKWDLV